MTKNGPIPAGRTPVRQVTADISRTYVNEHTAVKYFCRICEGTDLKLNHPRCTGHRSHYLDLKIGANMIH
jgi:hypothetical protein